MRLDEDDLYDNYSDGSYDDAGADEIIDEVLAALKPASLSREQVEAELEKADWDAELATTALRRALAKAAPRPKPTPKAEPKADAPKGKLNSLQMLAQKRAQQRAASETTAAAETRPDKEAEKGTDSALTRDNEVRTLDKAGHPPDQASGQAPDQAGEPPKSKLSGLAALRRKPAVPSGGLASLSRLRESRIPKASTAPDAAAPAAPALSTSSSSSASHPASNTSSKPPPTASWRPEIVYTVPAGHGLRPPSEIGAVLGQRGPQFPRTLETNYLATAQQASQAFGQPSPDDRVLQKQAGAFQEDSSKGASGAKGAAKNASAAAKGKTKSKAKVVAGKGSGETLAARLAELQLKPSCAFVVIGHVDAGKSTLMGRLLLDTGALSAKVAQRHEHESAKAGKASFALAWALDATSEERERGVTVDIGEAHFETAQCRYTVLDAPGHRDYVPNMIAGVSQADVAVLVVDSDTNAFEAGFTLDGQTKEHAVLARSLGIATIVVAVNKMDTQQWDYLRFEEIRSLLVDFLTKKVGFAADQCVFVPTSGMTGANVVHGKTSGKPAASKTSTAKLAELPAELTQWYDGPSLVGALDAFVASSAALQGRRSDDTARFVVSNAFTEAFHSTVTVSGRMLSGGVQAGDHLEVVRAGVAAPADQEGADGSGDGAAAAGALDVATVKAVAEREFLVAGDIGDLKIEAPGEPVRAGDVLAGTDAGVRAVRRFTAKVRLFDVPRPVLPGTKLAFHLGRTEDTVQIVRIVEALGKTAAAAPGRAKKVRHLGRGSAALVELELTRPVVLALPETSKDLGRFVLRMNGATIGGGVVDSF